MADERLRAGDRPARFVGRTAEVQAIRSAIARGRALVLVEGEPGVGKSRCITEALRARKRVFTGAGHPLRDPFPYGPVADAVRRALRAGLRPDPAAVGLITVLEPILPDLVRSIGPTDEDLASLRADVNLQCRAFLELVEALAPMDIVLEDLHWADGGTCDLLTYLIAEQPEHVNIVLSLRREDVLEGAEILRVLARLPTRAVRVGLSPLSRGEVEQMLSSLLVDTVLPANLVERITAASGGIPFAVEEFARLVAPGDPGGDDPPIPGALRDVTLERVRRLGTDVTAVLRALAILGTAAKPDEIGAVADLTDDHARRAIDMAISAALLDERDGFAFRNELTQQIMIESIPPLERRALHARAAAYFGAGGDHATLARHLRGANDPRWIDHAEAAADEATRVGNDRAASAWLREILAAAEGSARRSRLAVKLGRASLMALEASTALDEIRRLLDDEATQGPERGELRLLLGWLLFDEMRASEAYVELCRAMSDLADQPALLARACAMVGVPWFAEGTIHDHERWLSAAEEAAARSGDPLVELAVTGDVAYARMLIGDASWRAGVDRIPRDPPSLDHRRETFRAFVNLADAALTVGLDDEAREFLARAETLLESVRRYRHVPNLEDHRLTLALHEGRLTRVADRVVATNPAAGSRTAHHIALLHGWLAYYDARLGAAAVHFQEARDVALRCGYLVVDARAAAGLATVRLAQDRLADAQGIIEGSLEAIRRKGIWPWAAPLISIAAEIAAATGDHRGPARMVDEYADGISSRDAPAADAALLDARGSAARAQGNRDEAAALHARAAAAWDELPRPISVARSKELAGAALSGPQSRALLGEALDAYSEIGSRVDANRVRRRLREAGVRATGRTGRRGYGGALTPRELEIARLAAEGMTDREIAASLFLSPRTVSNRMGGILKKLGVEGRRGLRSIKEWDST